MESRWKIHTRASMLKAATGARTSTTEAAATATKAARMRVANWAKGECLAVLRTHNCTDLHNGVLFEWRVDIC